MKDIKIVICDLDGTLYNDEKTVSDYTVETILKLRNKGVLFGIASGRDAFIIEKAIKKELLEQIDIIIGDNGFHIKDYKNKQDYYGTYMKPHCIQEICSLFKDLDYLGVYVEEESYKAFVNGDMTLEEDHLISDYVTQEEMFTSKISKFGIFFKEKDLDTVRQRIDTMDTIDYYAVKAGINIYDFQGHETNKIHGLYRYLKETKLTINQVMFFGDSGNDYEMIKNIPHSVAMINADKDILSLASDKTKYNNNEDGVAKYLETYFNL